MALLSPQRCGPSGDIRHLHFYDIFSRPPNEEYMLERCNLRSELNQRQQGQFDAREDSLHGEAFNFHDSVVSYGFVIIG
jgi:hypothetical protein